MKNSPARNINLKKRPSKLMEDINSSIDVDSRLYHEDIIASIAHTKMLIKTKIISNNEGKKIISGLNEILQNIKNGKVKFQKKHEDIHMNIEVLLQKKIGSIAGKLHTARSRNDQVVTDFKLWIKKHSLIIDRKLFSYLDKHANEILKLKNPYIEKVIYEIDNLNLQNIIVQRVRIYFKSTIFLV